MNDRQARRYLVAPDKFKGTLTGPEAADAIARGIRRADPGARIVSLPFADGGEGTVEAIVHAGG
jgi:glycerate kinase